MFRPTVNDIAKEAGVSLATVRPRPERAPGRAGEDGASGSTRRSSGSATSATSRPPTPRAPAQLTGSPSCCPNSETAFIAGVARRDRRPPPSSAAFDRTAAEIVTVPAFDPTATVRALAALEGLDWRGADGAGDPPGARRDRAARARGGRRSWRWSPTSPNSARKPVRGHQQSRRRPAPRRSCSGAFAPRPDATIMVLAGSMMARDQMERRLGFDEVMLRWFPEMTRPAVGGGARRFGDRGRAAGRRARRPPRGRRALRPRRGASRPGEDPCGRSGSAIRITVVAHELTPAARAGGGSRTARSTR